MFKKCDKCNNIIYVINNDNKIMCCNNEMRVLKENSKDASFEKHIPNITIENDKIKVVVNHVMEEDHFIEWIALENDNEINIKRLTPNTEAIACFEYKKGAYVYSYCNKHGLWKIDIK